MADVTPLSSEPRRQSGRGASRAIRRAGRVPGIIYGAKFEPMLVTFSPLDLAREYDRAGFYSRIFAVGVDGKTIRVLAREVQLDPVTDRPIHVDFLHLTPDSKVNVEVEVKFIGEGECPGIKRGGVLNIVRHRVELICPVDRIPESIVVNLAGLDIGHGAKISSVTLPEGVRPRIGNRDFTIATIAAPTVLISEEEEAAKAAAAAAAAGEVPAEGAVAADGTAAPAEGAAADAAKGGDAKGGAPAAKTAAPAAKTGAPATKAEKKPERKVERKGDRR